MSGDLKWNKIMGACLGTEELVYCVDGDGGFLMHMGSAPVIAQRARDNYRYVLINNGAHESVGGQPTVAFGATVSGRPVDLPGIEQQLGLFINTLPVVGSPRPEQSVAE